MRLMDSNSVKIPGVKDFEWAPSKIPGEKRAGVAEQHMLCYWMPEEGNSPAKVALMNVPSKEVVRTKNLFNVSDVFSLTGCKLIIVQIALAIKLRVFVCQGRSPHKD